MTTTGGPDYPTMQLVAPVVHVGKRSDKSSRPYRLVVLWAVLWALIHWQVGNIRYAAINVANLRIAEACASRQIGRSFPILP